MTETKKLATRLATTMTVYVPNEVAEELNAALELNSGNFKSVNSFVVTLIKEALQARKAMKSSIAVEG